MNCGPISYLDTVIISLLICSCKELVGGGIGRVWQANKSGPCKLFVLFLWEDKSLCIAKLERFYHPCASDDNTQTMCGCCM